MDILKKTGIIIFFIIISLMMVLNITNADSIWRNTEGDLAQKTQALDSYMSSSIAGKPFFTEIYGIMHNVLHLDVVGNFEFVRDKTGLMQFIWNDIETEQYVDDVIELNEVLAERGIPFLFVELPDRGAAFEFSQDLNYFGKRDIEIERIICREGISIMDLQDAVKTEDPKSQLDYFFRSDIHLTTKAEMENARRVTEFLTQKGVSFPATKMVYDRNSYSWDSYTMWGNFGRSSGKIFSGLDIFDVFTPDFETRLQLTIPDNGTITEGDFSAVMTKGFSDPDNSQNLYWVTNYGNWPMPCYFYDNLLFPDGPELLLIIDSLSMRAATFLALNAAHVTILDPRYFGETDYLQQALSEKEFDAVILFDTTYLHECALF